MNRKYCSSGFRLPLKDTFRDESGPEIESVDIVIPKRKDEIEAEQRLAAKKAFAKKLAELYSTMKDSSRYASL